MRENFYTKEELSSLGLKTCGEKVLVSRKASIYSPGTIELGNNVRIDDFCILSGSIKIGNNVHISAGVYLYGKSGIEFGDYSGCSAHSVVYSEVDDFSGEHMVGAMSPDELRHVIGGKVFIDRYAQLGANSIVMPGVSIREGAVTGAMTFVNCDLEPWTVNVGIPVRKLKNRSMGMLNKMGGGCLI